MTPEQEIKLERWAWRPLPPVVESFVATSDWVQDRCDGLPEGAAALVAEYATGRIDTAEFIRRFDANDWAAVAPLPAASPSNDRCYWLKRAGKPQVRLRQADIQFWRYTHRGVAVTLTTGSVWTGTRWADGDAPPGQRGPINASTSDLYPPASDPYPVMPPRDRPPHPALRRDCAIFGHQGHTSCVYCGTMLRSSASND